MKNQFNASTGENKKYFIYDMHKLAVDATFTHMKYKEVINSYGYRRAKDMYKEYIQLEDTRVMVSLDPDSLTILHNKVSLR